MAATTADEKAKIARSSDNEAEPKAAKKTLCPFTIKDGCHKQRCQFYHPVAPDLAKAEYETKKTTAICGFYPACKRANCTWLHIEVQPLPPFPEKERPAPLCHAKTKSAANAQKAKDVRAAKGARAALKTTDEKERKGGKKRQGRKEAEPPKEPAVLRTLGRIRGKIAAISRVREAQLVLADSLAGEPAKEARLRAADAEETLQIADRQLLEFGEWLDEWLGVGAGQSDGSQDPELGGDAVRPGLPADSPRDPKGADDAVPTGEKH